MAEESASKRARFASLEDADLDVLVEDRVPKTTKRSTDHWMQTFQTYLEAKNVSFDMATCSKTELSSVLSSAYAELRRQDGQPYQRASLLGFRGAVHRRLGELQRDFDVYKDAEFKRANAVLDGQLKNQKREGDLKATEHKEPISDLDMVKLKAYFEKTSENPTPIALTEQVWFALTYHLSLRG